MSSRLRIPRALGFLAIVALFVASACSEEEIVLEPYLPSSAYDAYSHSLAETNLAGTALGRDWIASGERALSAPVEVSSPFEETGYFDAARPAAVGYHFSVLAGQRIEAAVQVDSTEPLRIFLDLYRVPEEVSQGPLHVASSPAKDPRLQFKASSRRRISATGAARAFAGWPLHADDSQRRGIRVSGRRPR